MSVQDQARFFGSEDYYQAHGGTPRDFVIGLYGDVLGRAPTSAEIDRWVSRLSSCGDGVTMSREFLISAQSELIAHAPVVPPCPPDGRPCYYP